jgi:SAM-dependent methyltransferase
VNAAHVPDDRLALEPPGTPARHLALRALHALGDAERDGLHAWLWERLAPPSGIVDVLDVGAGSAQPWLAHRGPIPTPWRITLLDRAPDAVEAGQRAVAGLGRTATGVVADAVDLPFPDATFDLVLAHHVLYHLPQRGRAIAELRRVLRPGGRLVAATNGGGHLADAVTLLGEVQGAWPALRVATPEPLGFTLENGAAQLAVSFAGVECLSRATVPIHVPADALARYLLALTFTDDAAEAAEVAAWVASIVSERVGDALATRRVSGAFLAR